MGLGWLVRLWWIAFVVHATLGKLTLTTGNTFKIAQFTDMHYAYDVVIDGPNAEVEYTVLETERPDLVAITGDAISGTAFQHRGDKEKREWEKLTLPMRELGIPWATTFGNHDADGDLDREQLLEIDQSLGSLTLHGPSDIPGVTNYYLPIYDTTGNQTVAVLWFFDLCDNWGCENVSSNACVSKAQVEWYKNETAKLGSHFGLFFLHVPTPEYVDLWNYEVTYGTKGEDVCCPVVNTGLYDAALESGDIHGMFVGHDHHNDYCGSFAAHPQLMLCYGRKTGFGYSNPEWPMHHGSRIIEITLHSDNSVDFTTWIRDDLGERIDNPAHEPTGPGQLSCTA